MWKNLIEKIKQASPVPRRKSFVRAIVELYNAMADCQYWYERIQSRPTRQDHMQEGGAPRVEWMRSVGQLGKAFVNVEPVLSIFHPRAHAALKNYYQFESLEATASCTIEIIEAESGVDGGFDLDNRHLGSEFSDAVSELEQFIRKNIRPQELFAANFLSISSAERYRKPAKSVNKVSVPAKIFYSYSHDDEDLRDQLDKHLSGLRHGGFISSWHDRAILPGKKWGEKINREMLASNIFLMLVSSSFLSSSYCYGIEMAYALDRHGQGDAIVVPIILRPVDWQDTPLRSLQALPKNGRAVTEWPNHDEAFQDIARGLRRLFA